MLICTKTLNEYTFTEHDLKKIIQRWTDDKVKDSTADREAPEEIVRLVCPDGNMNQAASLIDKWRKEKIEQIYDNEYEYEYE